MDIIKKVDLIGGGKLYYVKNKISKTTDIDIQFACGSRCDTIPGLAHFSEHMFFSGTKDLTADEINKKYFDFIDVNAATTSSMIEFYGTIFTKEVGDYLSLVAKMITETTFSQKAVDKEIKVIQQEIARSSDKHANKSSLNNDYSLMQEECLKNETLGSKESVASIKSKDVKNFVKKYFVKENVIVFISSPMPFFKVKNLVSKNLISKLNSNPKFKKLPKFIGEIKDDSFYNIKNENIKKNYLYINFVKDHDYYDLVYFRKLGLVLDMLNDSSQGIKKDLRLKKSLVYNARFSRFALEKEYNITLATECDSKNINEIIKTTAEYLKNIVANGFTQAQLDKAKRLYDYGEAAKEPRVSVYMRKLYMYHRIGKITNSRKFKETIKNTTLEECNQIFREIFSDPRVSMTIYGDASKKETLTKAQFKKCFKN